MMGRMAMTLIHRCIRSIQMCFFAETGQARQRNWDVILLTLVKLGTWALFYISSFIVIHSHSILKTLK